MTDLNAVDDRRTTRVYPDPDPKKSGRIGYFCHVCQREEIGPRYALPRCGYDLAALTKGAQPRLIWVCSVECLAAHVLTLNASEGCIDNDEGTKHESVVPIAGEGAGEQPERDRS